MLVLWLRRGAKEFKALLCAVVGTNRYRSSLGKIGAGTAREARIQEQPAGSRPQRARTERRTLADKLFLKQIIQEGIPHV